MLTILYTGRSQAPNGALRGLLQAYGLTQIIEWNQQTKNLSSMGQADIHHDSDGEVLIINGVYDMSSMAIRRLTLNTVRLPRAFIVWDGPLQQELVAARVPLRTFRNLLRGRGDLDLIAAVRVLERQDKKIVSATFQQFSSTSSTRIGGSFSKSGVRQYYGKTATGRGAKKLLDEIRMYQSLPDDELRNHYPTLLFASQRDGSVSMGTQYEEYPNLRDLLLNLQISPAEAAHILKKVLEVEYCQAFLKYRQPTPLNYLHDYHYHRVWRRIAISTELDPNFGPLVAAPWLEINGKRIPNVPAMLWRLEQDEMVSQRLDPGGVSPFIHADLHLENILCDTEQERFWLVDPRGYPACDIYYDLGKLAHSYNSCYDLLHEGRHESTYAVQGNTAIIDYQFLTPQLTEIYAELNSRMQSIIHELLQKHGEGNDVNIDLRIRFNEAMHFCSDMPFHIHPDAKPCISMPIYAIGAKLLAEVLDLLGISMDECVAQQDRGLKRLAEMGTTTWRFEG